MPLITGKNNKKLGFELIKSGISIFGDFSKKFLFLFLILVKFQCVAAIFFLGGSQEEKNAVHTFITPTRNEVITS